MDGEEEEQEKLCYRQRAEKAAGGEVVTMQWSPTMDVIALAFSDNSVVLNRLSWQRVWTVEAPYDVAVAGLSWRPDGRVLAVGYCNGCILLLDIEDGHCIHELSVGCEVCCLHWVQEENMCGSNHRDERDPFKDIVEDLLPPLPSVDTSLSVKDEDKQPACSTDPKRVKELLNKLNVLLVGDQDGRVHLCISGVLLATAFHISPTKESCKVLRLSMSPDLKHLVAMASSNDNTLCLYQMETCILSDWSEQFCRLSLLHSRLVTVTEYMEEVIKTMCESWEDGLLVMDTKLANYSSVVDMIMALWLPGYKPSRTCLRRDLS